MARYETRMLTNAFADAVQIRCPYCGTDGYYSITSMDSPFVVLCDIESGGCDKYFAAKVKLTATVTTMAIIDDE